MAERKDQSEAVTYDSGRHSVIERRYQDQPGRSFYQGIMNVREDARLVSRDHPIGAALAHVRRWGPLFLLVLAANTVIATLAWRLVGLFLN